MDSVLIPGTTVYLPAINGDAQQEKAGQDAGACFQGDVVANDARRAGRIDESRSVSVGPGGDDLSRDDPQDAPGVGRYAGNGYFQAPCRWLSAWLCYKRSACNRLDGTQQESAPINQSGNGENRERKDEMAGEGFGSRTSV